MLPVTMLEAVAALGLQALVLASLLSTSTWLSVLAHQVWTEHASVFAERQVEHVIDVSAARAGTGPSSPVPVASATPDTVVLEADLNGDGLVDAASSERTELELRRSSETSPQTLLHRIGNQGMTIEDGLASNGRILLIARNGAPGGPVEATGLEIPRRHGLLIVALATRLP